MSPDYEVASHRVTSISNYDDWKVISEGISLFYQGKGGPAFSDIAQQLNTIQQQGRDSYLVCALLSYSESLAYLREHKQEDREQALHSAKQAFELNPRCDIANLTLGLALLINQHLIKPSPTCFMQQKARQAQSVFTCSVWLTNSQITRKGSQYNYQRYTEMKKEHNGQLFDLIESSQKANLFQTAE